MGSSRPEGSPCHVGLNSRVSVFAELAASNLLDIHARKAVLHVE
jgi:hypothetical protein